MGPSTRSPNTFMEEGALKAIREALGRFISLDKMTLSNADRKVGRILVAIDIHEGLLKMLDIEWRGHHIKHRLDYRGIPFRCSWCWCTSHLRHDCSDNLTDEKSEDTLLQEDLPDYMMEVDSLGDVNIHYDTETGFWSEPDSSLSGKLLSFCPSLYSTLCGKKNPSRIRAG